MKFGHIKAIRVGAILCAAVAMLMVTGIKAYEKYQIHQAKQIVESDPNYTGNFSEAAAIGIIGGADGPTAIYVASALAPRILYYGIAGFLTLGAAAGTIILLIEKHRREQDS